MNETTGKWMITAGVALVAIGLVVWLAGDKLRWLGRLPGDIRIEQEHFRFYFPLTTMILASLLLQGLVWIYRHLIK